MGTFPNINNTYATVLCTTIGLPVKLALLHFAIMNCLPGHRRAAAIAGALVLKNMIGVFHFYTWIMRGSLSYGNIGDVFISKLMDNDSESASDLAMSLAKDSLANASSKLENQCWWAAPNDVTSLPWVSLWNSIYSKTLSVIEVDCLKSCELFDKMCFYSFICKASEA